MTAKAISVQQPWAWAIFRAGKSVENRRHARGPAAAAANFASLVGTTVLIQSSGKYAGGEAFDQIRALNPTAATDAVPGMPGRDPAWEFGSLLGTVRVESVHVAAECQAPYTTGPDYWCSKWAWPDAAHIVMTDPRLLRNPIVHPGRLGVWQVTDPTTLTEIRRRLS